VEVPASTRGKDGISLRGDLFTFSAHSGLNDERLKSQGIGGGGGGGAVVVGVGFCVWVGGGWGKGWGGGGGWGGGWLWGLMGGRGGGGGQGMPMGNGLRRRGEEKKRRGQR